MNWAASHLASINRKELWGGVQSGRFLKAERGWDHKVIKERKDYFRQGHLPLGEKEKSIMQMRWPHCAHQVIPDWLVKGCIPGSGWNCSRVLVCCPRDKWLHFVPVFLFSILTPRGPGIHEALSSDLRTDVVQRWLFPIISKGQREIAATIYSASGDTSRMKMKDLHAWCMK